MCTQKYVQNRQKCQMEGIHYKGQKELYNIQTWSVLRYAFQNNEFSLFLLLWFYSFLIFHDDKNSWQRWLNNANLRYCFHCLTCFILFNSCNNPMRNTQQLDSKEWAWEPHARPVQFGNRCSSELCYPKVAKPTKSSMKDHLCYVQIHQIVYIIYTQGLGFFLVHQLYLNKSITEN